jgi:hypothetical protein
LVSSFMTGASAQEIPNKVALSATNPWVLNPVLDFMFVFGGIVWLIFGICYFATGLETPTLTNAKWLAIIAVFAQRFLADPHNTATYFRIYATPESRKRFSFYCYVLPILVAPVFFVGIFNSQFAGAMGLIYALWVYQHYSAQSFGISLLYCYKQGYTLRPIERELFRWFVYCFIGLSFIRMFVFEDYRPKDMAGIPCPNIGHAPEPLYWFAAALTCTMTIGFVGLILKKLFFEGKMLPIPAVVILATVIGMGFFSGGSLGILWLFAPAFFHGSQYIAISLAYYLKERGLPENVGYRRIASVCTTAPALKYLGILLLSGVFMYVGIPEIFRQAGFDRNVVALSVLCVVNFHHFITDGAIWRLRDKKCREILLA